MIRWGAEKADAHTLVGPYILNAVDASERAVVEKHLRQCPTCAQEVAELSVTASSLSTPALAQPSMRLREDLLRQVRHTPQLPPKPQPQRNVTRTGNVRWEWRPQLAAAAMALALFAVLVTAVIINYRDDSTPAPTDRVAAVLQAEDAVSHSVSVDGTTLTVVSSRDKDASVVVPSGMAPAPSGKAYQLWLIKPDSVRSAGMMGSTKGTQLVTDIGDAQELGVTIEPPSGSRQPSTPPLMSVEL
ncbi:MAG: anti-sigma factor [Corynebacteriales bacterium]|nr:anti-sigma factor [Mycobacteriales bacterium]